MIVYVVRNWPEDILGVYSIYPKAKAALERYARLDYMEIDTRDNLALEVGSIDIMLMDSEKSYDVLEHVVFNFSPTEGLVINKAKSYKDT